MKNQGLIIKLWEMRFSLPAGPVSQTRLPPVNTKILHPPPCPLLETDFSYTAGWSIDCQSPPCNPRDFPERTSIRTASKSLRTGIMIIL